MKLQKNTMPILKINILGSKIEINYKENEKEKLIYLIEQFKNRLLEFENLKHKFTDNKIIFLAALKAEDNILELTKKIDTDKKTIKSFNSKENITDKQVKEIIALKDQLFSLKNDNNKLHHQNKIAINQINKLNQRLQILITKIIKIEDEDNDN